MTLIGNFVTSVPSVTNVYYFFHKLPRRVSFRSLRLRLRQCLLWCRGHVCSRAAVWPRICGAAHPCCRALVILPRARMLPLIRGAAFVYAAARLWCRALSYCRAPWCRARGQMVSVLCDAALHSAAHLYAAAPPWCRACGQMVSVLCVAASPVAAQFYVLPRSSLCCRIPCCRAVLCVAASDAAAQFYVLPRSMVPRSSTCCRVPCCRAVLCVAASHCAAQFYMLPRSMLPRSFLWCRVSWCRAVLHVAASHATALRSTCGRASVLSAAQFYVLPRSMVPRAAQRFESSPCCRAVVWIAIKGRLVPQS